MKGFIARDSDDKLFLYTPNHPIKAEKEWKIASKLDDLFTIDEDLFPEVKWEDEEPTEINIEIVSKH